MKVAIFVHCFFPRHFYGTETYTRDLARRLHEAGHEVSVVAAVFEGEPAQEQPVERYSVDDIPVISIDKNAYPRAEFRDTYHQAAMGKVLRDVLEELRPDLVHVTHLINHTAALLDEVAELELPAVATFTDFFGFCLNNRLEAVDGTLCAGPNPARSNCVACLLKMVSTWHGTSPTNRLVGRGPALRARAEALVRVGRLPLVSESALGREVRAVVDRPARLEQALRTCGAGITPTRFLREAYVRNGIRIPLHDIRFGVDTPRDPKPPRRPVDPTVIGYIGQLVPHKGVHLLVDAFSRLNAPAAELHIFGAVDQDPVYMRSLQRSAKGHAVHFRGTFPNEDMADVLAGLDLLVIPSVWYENSPLVLLNALATHTPVLVSDVAGLTEFVEPGVNGFTFERGDSSGLGAVLAGILSDPDLLQAMALTTEYSRTTQDMADDTVRVYGQLTAVESDFAQAGTT